MVWVPLFDCSASPGDGNAQAVHVFLIHVFWHGLDVNYLFLDQGIQCMTILGGYLPQKMCII